MFAVREGCAEGLAARYPISDSVSPIPYPAICVRKADMACYLPGRVHGAGFSLAEDGCLQADRGFLSPIGR